MRADRLLSLILLLQARGRMTAASLASELEVSVRTIYRDLEALSGAGVPVYAEAGPGGGCQLLDGYRSPLASLTTDEASALLVLGVPEPLRELGLAPALEEGHEQIRRSAGVGSATEPLVHLDMPRWFHSRESVPHLTAVANGVRHRQQLSIAYPERGGRATRERMVDPLGLVNKAGVWYLVAAVSPARVTVFRVGRIAAVRPTGHHFRRPVTFDLAGFWEEWSADFESSRPRMQVIIRVSPDVLRALPEIFGDAVRPALEAADPPDRQGWRQLTLSFEHERAAAYRLAGFGDRVEVLSPGSVRTALVAAARGTLRRHHGQPQPG